MWVFADLLSTRVSVAFSAVMEVIITPCDVSRTSYITGLSKDGMISLVYFCFLHLQAPWRFALESPLLPTNWRLVFLCLTSRCSLLHSVSFSSTFITRLRVHSIGFGLYLFFICIIFPLYCIFLKLNKCINLSE